MRTFVACLTLLLSTAAVHAGAGKGGWVPHSRVPNAEQKSWQLSPGVEVKALRAPGQRSRQVTGPRQRTTTTRRGGTVTKTTDFLDKRAALKSGGRSRAFTLTAPNGEAVTLSANDRAELITQHRDGVNEFAPTQALMGLFDIGRGQMGGDYNSHYVISGISRIEAPDESRTAALVSALDALTRLDEPLARLVKRGSIYDATYTLTRKGLSVARSLDAIARSTRSDGAWMLGYDGHELLRDVLVPQK